MKQEARDGIMNRGAWSARRKVAPLVMLATAVGMVEDEFRVDVVAIDHPDPLHAVPRRIELMPKRLP